MRKLLFIIAASLLCLAACSSNESEVEDSNQVDDSVSKEEVNEESEQDVEAEEEAEEVPEEEGAEEEEVADVSETVEEPVAEEEEEQETAVYDTGEFQISGPITADQVEEIITYFSIGEGDSLSNVSLVNGQISATIDLAPRGSFSPEDIAVTDYSQLSDELLTHEGWDRLTITYANIGTVSMNRMEKESNDYGDYFPTMAIEDQLTW
ncbi:hypothetical protein ANABIO32_03610 [Rossellomorea marisflavi]|uniref:hypothetical protein n=1 Tax=Rossellomorea marisflavi TaxID=189381 RepID=UPI0025C78B87|nr:hypothetical protein [Rossellomorea marisflavi]GLI82674.1 hypothetical protein ANABIO32_03610 [Rossellomorea marisflavi]